MGKMYCYSDHDLVFPASCLTIFRLPDKTAGYQSHNDVSSYIFGTPLLNNNRVWHYILNNRKCPKGCANRNICFEQYCKIEFEHLVTEFCVIRDLLWIKAKSLDVSFLKNKVCNLICFFYSRFGNFVMNNRMVIRQIFSEKAKQSKNHQVKLGYLLPTNTCGNWCLVNKLHIYSFVRIYAICGAE